MASISIVKTACMTDPSPAREALDCTHLVLASASVKYDVHKGGFHSMSSIRKGVRGNARLHHG